MEQVKGVQDPSSEKGPAQHMEELGWNGKLPVCLSYAGELKVSELPMLKQIPTFGGDEGIMVYNLEDACLLLSKGHKLALRSIE